MTRTFSLTCAVLGLLLMANIAAPGQAPPSTYYPAWFDGFPFFLGGEGVSPDGLWSFHWSSPPIKDEFQFGGCDPYEHCYFWWYGDLSPGGSFTLAGPDGWVFNGIFLRHGTFSGDYRSEFGIETGDEAFKGDPGMVIEPPDFSQVDDQIFTHTVYVKNIQYLGDIVERLSGAVVQGGFFSLRQYFVSSEEAWQGGDRLFYDIGYRRIRQDVPDRG